MITTIKCPYYDDNDDIVCDANCPLDFPDCEYGQIRVEDLLNKLTYKIFGNSKNRG